MPKGPNGQKRPADAIGLAVLVGRIATGEVEDILWGLVGHGAQENSLCRSCRWRAA